MIPVPWGKAFMMPVARVMSLYRRHTGTKALNVCEAPSTLDVTASREGNKVFLHVVNTNRINSVSTEIQLREWRIRSARSFEITAPPELEIMHHNADALSPVEKVIPKNMKWTFPAASVSAVEISDGCGRSTYDHARKQS